MKRYKVKHYFVLARIVKKDGSLSKSFSSRDFLDRESAESYLKSCNERGIDKYSRKALSYQLIEYEAIQPKMRWQMCNGEWVEEFNTIYTPPKAVRDAYNKNLGLI